MLKKIIIGFFFLINLNYLYAKTINDSLIVSNLTEGSQESGLKLNIQYSSITTDYKTMDQMGGFNIVYDLVKSNSDVNYLMACSSLQSAMLLAASKKEFKKLFTFNGSVSGVSISSKESDYLFQDSNKYKLNIKNNNLYISNNEVNVSFIPPYKGFLYCSIKYLNNSINIRTIYIFQVGDNGIKN